MQVTLDQVFTLNKRLGSTVYAQETNGELVAASLPKRVIREQCLDDLIDSKGNLTQRALNLASEILTGGNSCK